MDIDIKHNIVWNKIAGSTLFYVSAVNYTSLKGTYLYLLSLSFYTFVILILFVGYN